MSLPRRPSRRSCALLALLCAGLAAPARGGDADELRAAVRTWQAAAPGTPSPAEALPGWVLARGRAAAAAVVHRNRSEAGGWSDPEVLAAALLLTARGRAELEAGADLSGAWFDLARGLLDSVADRSRRRAYDRDWTLALAAFHNARLDGSRSGELLDQATLRLGDEPQVLFAAARLHEALADRAYSGVGEVVSASVRGVVQPDLLAAQRLYEQGLQQVPGEPAARLRHARVLSLIGRAAAARRQLELLHAAPADSDTPCLAALFLGAVAEQENRSAEALAAYRAALATGRSPQVARLAVARVLRRTGDVGGARRVIEQMLAEMPASGDAWWRYQSEGFGEESDYAARFAGLWREARR